MAINDQLAEEHESNLTGRQWVLQKIHDWLTSKHGSRYFVLTGEPGSGKTAIAAHLYISSKAKQNEGSPELFKGDWLAAAHFCSTRDVRLINPLGFISALSEQLSQKYKQYSNSTIDNESQTRISTNQQVGVNHGTIIGVSIGNVYLPETSPEDLFYRSVIKPLSDLHQKDPALRTIILVDGIDESLEYSGRMSIPKLISRTELLPPNVRFILTSRQGMQIEQIFRSATIVNLSDSTHRGLADEDMLLYLKQKIKGFSDVMVQKLCQQANGNFLYARLVTDSLLRGDCSFEQAIELPTGLDALYVENLRKAFSREKELFIPKIVLGIITAAQENLSVTQIAAISKLSTEHVLHCLRTTGQFLLASNGNNSDDIVYSIYHKSFEDFLSRKSILVDGCLVQNIFWIALSEIHCKFADYFISSWGGFENQLPSLVTESQHGIMKLYGLKHVICHLERGGRPDLMHKMLSIEPAFLGKRWRQAKVFFGEMGSYLSDIECACRCCVMDSYLTEDEQTRDELLFLHVQYTMLLSVASTVADNISLPLLDALVKHDLWSFERAVSYVMRLRHAKQRGERLLGMLKYVPESYRSRLLDEIIRTAQCCESLSERVNLFSGVLPSLSPGVRDNIVRECLDGVLNYDHDWDSFKTLIKFTQTMSPYLDEPALEKLFAEIAKIEEPRKHLIVLIRCLVAIAEQKRPGKTDLDPEIILLMSELPVGQEPIEELQIFARSTSPNCRAEIRNFLIERRKSIDGMVTGNAATESYLVHKGHTQALIMELKEESQKEEYAAALLHKATYQEEVLPILTALPSSMLPIAISIVSKIKSTPLRLKTFVSLTAALASPLWKQWIDASLRDAWRYTSDRPQRTTEALYELLKIDIGPTSDFFIQLADAQDRLDLLMQFLPLIGPVDRQKIIEETFRVTELCDDQRAAVDFLKTVVPYLSPEQLSEALRISLNIRDRQSYADAWCRVAMYMDAPETGKILEDAFSVNRRTKSWKPAIALSNFHEHLSDAQRTVLINEAITLAESASQDRHKVCLLSEIAKYTHAKTRAGVIDIVLSLLPRIDDIKVHAAAFKGLATGLKKKERRWLLRGIVSSIPSSSDAYHIVRSVADCLSTTEADALFEKINMIKDPPRKWGLLSLMCPFISEDLRGRFVVALSKITDVHTKADCLAAIKPSASSKTSQNSNSDKPYSLIRSWEWIASILGIQNVPPAEATQKTQKELIRSMVADCIEKLVLADNPQLFEGESEGDIIGKKFDIVMRLIIHIKDWEPEKCFAVVRCFAKAKHRMAILAALFCVTESPAQFVFLDQCFVESRAAPNKIIDKLLDGVEMPVSLRAQAFGWLAASRKLSVQHFQEILSLAAAAEPIERSNIIAQIGHQLPVSLLQPSISMLNSLDEPWMIRESLSSIARRITQVRPEEVYECWKLMLPIMAKSRHESALSTFGILMPFMKRLCRPATVTRTVLLVKECFEHGLDA